MKLILLLGLLFGVSTAVLAVSVRPATKTVPPAATHGTVAAAGLTNAVPAARAAVRNPFWPIGYEGERAVISAENRAPVPVRPSDAPEESETSLSAAPSEIATAQHWIAARRSLRVGGTVIVRDDDGTTRTSVIINGNAYADGDYVSITHHGRRFTWRVKGLTDSGVLKLIRVRARLADVPAKGIKP